MTLRRLCGSGFLTEDGKIWRSSGAVLRPAFQRDSVVDFDKLEKCFALAMQEISGDCSAAVDRFVSSSL